MTGGTDANRGSRAGDETTPVLLVPGIVGEAAEQFAFVGPMLAARRPVTTVQFDAGASGQVELDDLADQVERALDDSAYGRPVMLVGQATGALAALRVAARRPDAVESLVLVSGWLEPDARLQLACSVWRTLRAESSAALGEYMTFCTYSGAYLAARTAPELRRLPRQYNRDPAEGPGALLDQLMELSSRVDVRDVVRDVIAPALVVGCTHDQLVPPRFAKLLFGALDSARYAEVASGHGVFLERPAELLRLIDRFATNPSELPAGAKVPTFTP